MPTMFLLDGHSLAFRAFYAIDAKLTTKDGRPTNAVYGFALMLHKLIEQHRPDYLVASFDRGAPSARLARYPEYKAQRDRMPEELRLQVDLIKELLGAYGVLIFESDEHEADDVIGTLATKASLNNIDSVIVTSDRDALQLVGPHVQVMLTKRGVTETELCGEREVREKYGLAPAQLIDLKAFMGDTSDNIKGVRGIGEKTALALVQQFGSVEGVYQNLQKISKPRLVDLLTSGVEEASLSKFLATIVRDLEIDVDFSSLKAIVPDVTRLKSIYRNLELNSLASKIDSMVGENAREVFADVAQVELGGTPTAKTALYEENGICILARQDGVLSLVAQQTAVSQAINDLLERQSQKWVVNGYKELMVQFGRQGVHFGPLVFDVGLATYLIDPTKSSYTTLELAATYLGKDVTDLVSQAAVLLELEPIIANELREKGLEELFYQVELPLSRVLADMELLGFAVDRKVLVSMATATSERLHSIISEIYSLAGSAFNISSPKQLGVILFEKLGLPVIKKTKTGYSTDAEVLETLADRHPLVSKILEYRTLAKLQSTYLEGLQKVIDDSGKIHTTYNQTVAATGRLSSTEPNLQNIPIRLPEGRLIRKAFTPSSGYTHILTADYSQVELRILAHLSKDPILTQAFQSGEDIHCRTAAEVFGVSLAEVTPEMRARAKAVNFGIVYGISDYGLAKDIKVTRGEAREYIDNYFHRYRGVKEYIDRTISEARLSGSVFTLLNRRRSLPDINSSNHTLRAFAERTAMNTPIQGTAADLIKIAMVNVHRLLKENSLKSRMILSVHDELVFETTEDEIVKLQPLVRQAMEHALTLTVDLVVDFKMGVNWYELSPMLK